MKKSAKIIAISVMVAAMVVPAAAAHATSAYLSFNVNLPSMSEGIIVANQTKSHAAAPGEINVGGVAEGYTLNARQCSVKVYKPQILDCGTERRGLAGGNSASLPSQSKVKSGNTAFLQAFNNKWTIVRVASFGSWRAN